MKSREEIFQIILGHLKVVRIVNGVAHCICPGHLDDKPSLHVSMGDKKIVLDCKAGCNYMDILNAIGLRPEQLYYDYYNKPDRRVSREQYYLKKNCEAEYPFQRIDTGETTHFKYRMPGKGFKQGYDKDGKWIYNLQGIDTSLSIFSNCEISKLKMAAQNGEIIAYFEGEKDTLNGRKYDLIGLTCGNVSDWKRHKKVFEYIKGAKLIIFADDDANDSGLNNSNQLKEYFESLGGQAAVIVPAKGMNIKGGDFTDYMKCHTKDDLKVLIDKAIGTVTENRSKMADVTEMQSGLSQDKVRSLLIYKIDYDKDGNEKSRKICQTVRNFEIIMENDPRFAGKIKFDEFSQQAYLMGDVPWSSPKSNYRAWSSYDDSALFSILQSDYGMNSRNDYFDAIKNVSMRHKFHPVRDLLDSFVWDGNEHIRNLLPDYLGVDNTDYQYQVMRLWMLGAVARVYQPGCKFDYTMILQGKQGIGKSTFLKIMALNDSWFNDSLDSLDSDKAAQSLMGSWIIELAELKSLARTAGGVESVKRFLTAVQDKYRVPYERRADIFLRQCVFAGTTNKNDFLQDETGNRRFLIIQTGTNELVKSLFVPETIDDIRAAWAQAVHIWKTEKPELLLPDSCREEALKLQEESMADDGKAGIIQEYLSDKQRTCAIEIWQEALKETGRPKKWQASEINNIVLSLPEWKKIPNPVKFGQYGSQRGFQKCRLQTPESDTTKEDCSQNFMELSDLEMRQLPFV